MSIPYLEPYTPSAAEESQFFHLYYLRFFVNAVPLGDIKFENYLLSTKTKTHGFFVKHFLTLLENHDKLTSYDLEKYCDESFCKNAWGLPKPFLLKRSDSLKLNDFWREAYSINPIRIENGLFVKFFSEYDAPSRQFKFPFADLDPQDNGTYYYVYMLWSKRATMQTYYWYVMNFFKTPNHYLSLKNHTNPLDYIFLSTNLPNGSKEIDR